MADNHFEAAPEGGVKLKDERPKVQDVVAPETPAEQPVQAEEAKPETAAEAAPEAGAENRTEETAQLPTGSAEASEEEGKPESTEAEETKLRPRRTRRRLKTKSSFRPGT
jgi:hypothetical protein